MTPLRSNPRKALTLLEVIITIFVMAIGFLSVLTLFPLAARKVVRSIDSDRVNLMAANASGSENVLGIRQAVQSQMDAELVTSGTPLLPSGIYHFDPIGVIGTSGSAIPVLKGLGAFKLMGLYNNPTADISLNSIRASFQLPPISDLKLREWLTSQDEIIFEPWGLPEPNFRKGNRYSVSFLYRRNTLADRNSLETLMLVYAARSIEFGNDTGTRLSLQAPADNTASTLVINDPVQSPGGPDRVFGRGAWLMDVSSNLISGKPRWKKFYQVQTVENNGNGQLTVSLDRNLEADSPSSANVFPVAQDAKLIWVDYLFDWFDRGIGP
jgi:hypothetical protein